MRYSTNVSDFLIFVVGLIPRSLLRLTYYEQSEYNVDTSQLAARSFIFINFVYYT